MQDDIENTGRHLSIRVIEFITTKTKRAKIKPSYQENLMPKCLH